MAEYAPKAITACFATVKRFIPSAQFSGVLGDSSHTYGYHRSRNALPGNDYSVVQGIDRKGDGNAASALDISFPPAGMKLVTTRLIDAARRHDPRMQTLREFFGTVTGKTVTGLDVQTLKWVTSDPSHLWHLHCSGHRAYVNDAAAWQRVAQVICGQGSAPAPKPPAPGAGPKLRRAWPAYMKSGHYFGLISGPDQCHGGYYVAERPDIQAIQARLVALGYGKGVKVTPGVFQATTATMVGKWQKAKVPGTKFYGQVWSDDWKKLFTY